MISSLLNRFHILPPGAKIAVGGGFSIGVFTLMKIAGVPWKVLLIILAGVLVMALIVMAYFWILRMRNKRKSDPFEQQLRASGAAVPQEVSDVADRARLDQMRNRFETGLKTFREKGKDLYGLPWYVIIGEPGSGKTEAIRNSGIGFPPGLQDELQGTGGTINMDWWFTNDAVILDTAGRLTFGDVESTDNNEWKEFLRLLRKSRPRCPINGLIVTIPVDTLIQDDASSIEAKGGKIARQLDLIQTALGVRFPVVLVVTKADMLTGFRQFFKEVRDPRLQHQMIGWSNPNDLDEAFDPGQVERHLEDVKNRLTRRRYTMMLPSSDGDVDPNEKRVDRMDELYAFPEALERIGSRLRRYLEMIFVGGAWSSQPLFLRGIYFTSSVQHGAALDAELVEALGVSMDTINEQGWPDNRAYFLRDVFREKVFKENGLVTNAGNARQRQRQRQMAVLGAGAAASLVLAILIVIGITGYRSEVRPQLNHWAETSEDYVGEYIAQGRLSRSQLFNEDNHEWQIVRRSDRAGGGFEGPFVLNPVGATGAEIPDVLGTSKTRADTRVSVPWAFKLAAVFSGQSATNLVASERREALAALFETGVVVPLLRGSMHRITESDVQWDADASTALATMLEIHEMRDDAEFKTVGAGTLDIPERQFRVLPLLRFALFEDPEATEEALIDIAEKLQPIADWLYVEDYGRQRWPSDRVADAVDEGRLREMVSEFNEDMYDRLAGGVGEKQNLESLVDALGDFSDAERELLALRQYQANPDTLEERIWNERFASVSEAKQRIDRGLAAAQRDTLVAEERRINEEVIGRAEAAYNEMLAAVRQQPVGEVSIKEFGALPSEDDGALGDAADLAGSLGSEFAGLLRDGWRRLEQYQVDQQGSTQSGGRLAELDAMFVARAGSDPGSPRRIDVRFQMYETADDLLRGRTEVDARSIGMTASRIDEATRQAERAVTRIASLATEAGARSEAEGDSAPARARDAQIVAGDVVAEGLANRVRARNEAQNFVDWIGRTSSWERIAERVRTESGTEEFREADEFSLSRVPLSVLGAEIESGESRAIRDFHPFLAASLFEDWSLVRSALGSSGLGEVGGLDRAMELYAEECVGYWTGGVVRDLEIALARPDASGDDRWSGFMQLLVSLDEHDITEDGLGEFIEDADEALQRMSNSIWDGATDARDDLRSGLADLRDARDSLDAEGARNVREQILRNWRRFSRASVNDAARDLLRDLEGRNPPQYFERGSPSTSLRDLVDRYWYDLGLGALRILAEEASQGAKDQWAELFRQDLARFPLGPYRDGGVALTTDELVTAAPMVRAAFRGELLQRRDRDEAAQRERLQGFPEEHQRQLNLLLRPLAEEDQQLAEQMYRIVEYLVPIGVQRVEGEAELAFVRPEDAPMDALNSSNQWIFLEAVTAGGRPDCQRVRGNSVIRFRRQQSVGNLELRFKETSCDEAADSGVRIRRRSVRGDGLGLPVFESGWGVFELLAEASEAELGPCMPDGDGDACWRVRLNVSKPGLDNRYVMWMQIRPIDGNLPEGVVRMWRDE